MRLLPRPRRAGPRAGRLAATAVTLGMLMGPAAVAPSPATAALASAVSGAPVAGHDPARSITPNSRFDYLCLTRYHGAACDTVALRWIDIGRHSEGLPPMHPPRGFDGWSTPRQLRWVTNSERGVRHLPPLWERSPLDHLALLGALAGRDPSGPSDTTWGSNIAWGYSTALAADFGWMYDDGPRSPNVGCRSAGSPGCWGHRHNILAPWPGYQGAAVSVQHGVLQMTELFVRV